MKNYFGITLLIGALFYGSLASAEFTNGKCDYVLTGNKVIQVNRQWDPATRTCFLSISPRNVVNLTYRDFYFDNSGRFMVFNSYGPGPDSTHTGARDFFLFPIESDYPDYSFEPNDDLIVKMVSGHQLRISGKDFSLVSLSSGKVSEKPVSTKNAGGVEITLQTGFWMDTGFRLGGLNIADAAKRTLFKSAKQTSVCSMKNNLFMDYTHPDDPEFRLTGDAFLKFTKSTCPQLGL